MSISGGPTGRGRTMSWTIPFRIDSKCANTGYNAPNPSIDYPGGWNVGTQLLSGTIAGLLGCMLTANPAPIFIGPGYSDNIEFGLSRVQGNSGSDNISTFMQVAAADYVPLGILTLSIPCLQRVRDTNLPGTNPQDGVNGLVVDETVVLRQPQNDFANCSFTLVWGALASTGNFLLEGPIYDLLQVQFSGSALSSSGTIECTPTCASYQFGYGYSNSVSETTNGGGFYPNTPLGVISYFTGGPIGISLAGGVTLKIPFPDPIDPSLEVLYPENFYLGGQMSYSQANRRYTVSGAFKCFADDYPGSWSVLYSGNGPKGSSSKLGGNNVHSTSFNQDSISCNGPAFPVVPDSDFLHVTPDPLMVDVGNFSDIPDAFGPPMGKALVWNALSISCAKSVPFFPPRWAGIGGTNVAPTSNTVNLTKTKNGVGLFARGTFKPDFLVGYRYLSFSISDLQGATEVIVTMNGLIYTVSLSNAGTVEVDLCLPDSSGYLFQDSMGPFAPGTPLEPTSMIGRWGLKVTSSIDLQFDTKPDKDGNTGLSVSNFQLFRKASPTVEFLKALNCETPYIKTTFRGVVIQQTWDRGICAMVDGCMAWETGSWQRVPPSSPTPFEVADWISYVSLIPGWSMSTLAPGQSFTTTGITACDEIGGGGWCYPTKLGDASFARFSGDYTSHTLADGPNTIPAQLFYDFLYSYPGQGDIDTGIGYGDNTSYAVYRFMPHVKGKGWGIANPQFVGKTLALISEKDGTSGGTAVVNPDGSWQSGLPYCAHGVTYDIQSDGKKAGSIAMFSERRNAIQKLQVSALSVELSNGIIGYWLFAAGNVNGLVSYRSWHADLDLDPFIVIDKALDCQEPQAYYIPEGRILGVIYRRGSGSVIDPYIHWRAISDDESDTWSISQLMTGYKHVRETYNLRTKERIIFKIDSNLLLQSTIYDAYDQKIQDSPTDQSGIFQAVCADASFGSAYITELGFLDVTFVDATGTVRRARSTDEGRSYSEVFGDQPS